MKSYVITNPLYLFSVHSGGDVSKSLQSKSLQSKSLRSKCLRSNCIQFKMPTLKNAYVHNAYTKICLRSKSLHSKMPTFIMPTVKNVCSSKFEMLTEQIVASAYLVHCLIILLQTVKLNDLCTASSRP